MRTALDGYPVEVPGNLETLVLVAEDRKGSLARITSILAEHDVNIATPPGEGATVSDQAVGKMIFR